MRVLLVALALLAALPARAETLIVSLSAHSLKIRPNFDGSQIVVFGAIERDGATISRSGAYEIAVSARGPATSFVVREKLRTLGLWVNRYSRTFNDRPSYFYSATTRGLMQNIDKALLAREKIGLAAQHTADHEHAAEFESALVRASAAKGLYAENATGVTFLTPTLFRATIPVPSNTPLGDYEVRVHLFAGGAMLARTITNFEVTKTGFEAAVANVAQKDGLFYGIVCVLLALFTGWMASIIFRRD